MESFRDLRPEVRQYFIITGNYWAFTLTDGALRMLIVLYFHNLGYSPFDLAMLFLFYEFFGVVTNLLGGWLGARIGLNNTMNIGLILQVIALSLLLVPSVMLTVPLVMFAQALSGIAKDLNKMSAKSAVKHLVSKNDNSRLYSLIALLTGSKNTLKGVGFFLGGVLLAVIGFEYAIFSMALTLAVVWIISLLTLRQDLGKASKKPKFSHLFSKSKSINYLSAARLFLFGSRDIWFVVALPVYLTSQLNWNHSLVGAFMAVWIIGYGVIQSFAPRLTSNKKHRSKSDGRIAFSWALKLAVIPMLIAIGLSINVYSEWILVLGLMIFGIIFAINSSFHSYLIVKIANEDGVSLDVGFYYMANAMGRLLGTLLSGFLFQFWGIEICLIVSTVFILISALTVKRLPE
ncbi:MAG: organoarsenical effux MFS transporter ArsJ [Gammaproteobacteria bacterium]|nr:organoarsenical effux MFS transporter ArsJ [Gammaproteobacteria bacterium]